jgi:hypothetical protein
MKEPINLPFPSNKKKKLSKKEEKDIGNRLADLLERSMPADKVLKSKRKTIIRKLRGLPPEGFKPWKPSKP